MCNNCAFSLEDHPNECLECDICIRHPKNVSKRFEPAKYKDLVITNPIDMYISKEHMAIIRAEIQKIYMEGLRAGRGRPALEERWDWFPHNHPWVFWSLDSKTGTSAFSTFWDYITWTSGDTLSVTYNIQIPTIMQGTFENTDPEKLEIDKEIGVIVEDPPKNGEPVKTLKVDLEKILEEMGEVEVGNREN